MYTKTSLYLENYRRKMKLVKTAYHRDFCAQRSLEDAKDKNSF